MQYHLIVGMNSQSWAGTRYKIQYYFGIGIIIVLLLLSISIMSKLESQLHTPTLHTHINPTI